jgi:hypothetical protein
VTTETRTIDADKALELLHQAVETRGREFSYRHAVRFRGGIGPVCRYEFDGNADCLIGTALALFNVPLDALKAIDAGEPEDHEHDDDCPADCGDASIHTEWAQRLLEQHGHVALTSAAAQVFRAAQAAQDTGSTWGYAEADAIDLAKSLGTV